VLDEGDGAGSSRPTGAGMARYNRPGSRNSKTLQVFSSSVPRSLMASRTPVRNPSGFSNSGPAGHRILRTVVPTGTSHVKASRETASLPGARISEVLNPDTSSLLTDAHHRPATPGGPGRPTDLRHRSARTAARRHLSGLPGNTPRVPRTLPHPRAPAAPRERRRAPDFIYLE
jgi:hypothetical protein